MFCQNNFSQNISFEKNPKKFVVEACQNIFTARVHCWYIKDAIAELSQEICGNFCVLTPKLF